MTRPPPSDKQIDILSWLTHFYGVDDPDATVTDLFWDFHFGCHEHPDEPEHEPTPLSWCDYSYEGIRATLKRCEARGWVRRTGEKPPYGWEPTEEGLDLLAAIEGWVTE